MDNALLTTTITGATEALRSFLAEWCDVGKDYVTARTSGSTGVPKPIRLPKADMLVSARSTCRQFGLTARSLLALPLSADYIAGKMMVVRAMVAGCRLYVEEPSSHPFACCDAHPGIPTMASVVPMQLRGLLEAVANGRVGMPEVLLVGGAPLSSEMEHSLMDAGVNAYVTYGMTETCSNVALRRIGQPLYEANPGVTFGVDSRGCLTVSWSEMSFGTIVTNDVVEVHDARHFRWLGRYDNVVNSGGIKLHPEAIEAKLASLLPAEQFCITSEPDAFLGRRLVAVVEKEIDLTPSLLDAVGRLLGHYERPRRWVEVDRLPRTTTGKISRSGLAELLG